MPAPYATQAWTDNVTPADAAHMNHIEAGIASADDSLTYRGDYAAGTTYYDGDVVVAADGFCYLCVKDGVVGSAPVAFPGSNGGVPLPVVNGQWIKGVGGAAVWAALTQQDLTLEPYGTSLPASPFDGQTAVLVDSVTNPSYQWRFRYNAGSSSAYKWAFIGGHPYYAEAGALSGITALYPTWTVSGGPQITVPRAGDYFCTYCANANNNTVASGAMINIKGGAAGPPDGTLCYGLSSTANAYFALSKQGSVNCANAGDVLQMVYACHISGTASWDRRSLSVLPIRVA